MKIKLSNSFKNDLTKFLELLSIITILGVGFISIIFVGYIAQIVSGNSFSFVTDITSFSDLFLLINLNKLLMTLIVGMVAVVLLSLAIYIISSFLYYLFHFFKNIFLYFKENIIVHEEEKLQN